MGFIKRVGTLVRANINSFVTRIEDPEKIMDQAVQDMEEGLDRVRERVASLKNRARDEQRLIQKLGEQISFWQDRARELIRDDMEENAKDAVRRRRILAAEERKHKIILEEDEANLKEMEAAIKEMADRVQLSKVKRNILVKNIRLRKGIPESPLTGTPEMKGYDFEATFNVFRKIEEKIEEETELSYIEDLREKQVSEKEEKLIDEEIEIIKKNLKKGGSK